MNTHQLAQNIRDTAQSALKTGQAWPDADRMSVMAEALTKIEILCAEHLVPPEHILDLAAQAGPPSPYFLARARSPEGYLYRGTLYFVSLESIDE